MKGRPQKTHQARGEGGFPAASLAFRRLASHTRDDRTFGTPLMNSIGIQFVVIIFAVLGITAGWTVEVFNRTGIPN